jgi:PAS domain-containing protein
MEHLVVPTFVLDPDGRVMIWNRACERLTGLLGSEVVGTKEHWRGFYDEPRPCLADLVLQGASGEALYAELAPHTSDPGALTAENWCVMPQIGSRRYLAVDAGPIFSESGELLAVVETLRDITIQHEPNSRSDPSPALMD